MLYLLLNVITTPFHCCAFKVLQFTFNLPLQLRNVSLKLYDDPPAYIRLSEYQSMPRKQVGSRS